MLLRRLEFSGQAGVVAINALSHEDILIAAAWLASMFRSAGGG
jgi:hypothetical protein